MHLNDLSFKFVDSVLMSHNNTPGSLRVATNPLDQSISVFQFDRVSHALIRMDKQREWPGRFLFLRKRALARSVDDILLQSSFVRSVGFCGVCQVT